MTNPTYPSGVFSWGTDRVDYESIDLAEDANSLAAEVVALESTLGTDAQTESSPVAGNPVSYATVDARISDNLAGNQLPVCILGNPSLQVPNFQSAGTNYGAWNTYSNVNFDPFNMYNGTDVTIPALGLWRITIGQQWDWWSTGYHACYFYLNNNYFRQDIWHWDFAGNSPGGWWYTVDDIPRPGSNKITWEGILGEGDRIQVLSENGCPDTPHRTFDQEFKAVFVRSVPLGTPTG
jgi:hypothetical protein